VWSSIACTDRSKRGGSTSWLTCSTRMSGYGSTARRYAGALVIVALASASSRFSFSTAWLGAAPPPGGAAAAAAVVLAP
jgi:hypothetical protein